MSSKGSNSQSKTVSSHITVDNTRSNCMRSIISESSDTTHSVCNDSLTLDDSNHSFQSRNSTFNDCYLPHKEPVFDVRPALDMLNIDVDRLAIAKYLFPTKQEPWSPEGSMTININEVNYKLCRERLVIIDQMIESMHKHGSSMKVQSSVSRLRVERMKVEEEMRELVLQMNESCSNKPGDATHSSSSSSTSSRPHEPIASIPIDSSSSTTIKRMESIPVTTTATTTSTTTRASSDTSDSSSTASTSSRAKRSRTHAITTTQQDIEVADILVSLMS